MFEITTIGLLLLFTILGGLFAKKIGQPIILGLLIVGTLAGPHMLNLISDEATIEFMTEIGTILFLFVIGLEFSVKKLISVGPKAIIVALLKVGIMFILGFTTIILLGFDTTSAVFTGILISFSSTMISISVLKQKKLIKRPEVPLLVAILIIEDILGVLALTFFSSQREQTQIFTSLHSLTLSLIVLVVVYIIFSKIAEQLVAWLMRNSGEETTAFISLGICAGFAYLASILGLSPGVGAFLGGSVVSSFRESKKFEQAVLPYTAMFSALFFISIGTIIDLTAIAQYWWLILLLLIVLICGMVISVGLVTKTFADFDDNSAIFSTVTMMPLGVFTLLIAKESVQHNVGFDLVTVSSVLVFVMALVMSIGIGYVHRITLIKQNRIMRGAARFSLFLRESLDELVLESTNSRKFRVRSAKTVGLALVISVVILTVLRYSLSLSGWVVWLIAGMGLALSVVLYLPLQKNFTESYVLLSRIISGIEGGTTIKRTKKILKYIFQGLSILILGLFSPMILYIAKLPSYYVVLSIGMCTLGLYIFSKSVRLLKGFDPSFKYNTRSYKKLDLMLKRGGSSE